MRELRSISVLGILVLLSITAACGGSSGGSAAGGDDSAAEPTGTMAVAADGVPLVAVDRHPHARLELRGGPDWMAADDRFLYVKLDRGAVARIDPDSLDVVGTTEIGGGLCQGIGAGYGAVWSCRGTDVVRIDPDTDEVVATIAVNKAAEQGHLAAGHDRIWVLVGNGSALVGIDPRTNTANTPIPLDIRGTDLAVDDTSVWVASSPDDQIVRVDPASGQAIGRLTLDAPRVINTDDGIWVGAGQSTVRIDPATFEVTTTVPSGPGREGDIAVDRTELWIRNADWLLRRADTTTGTVAEEITADLTNGGSVLVAFDAVWATAYDDSALFKITTTTEVVALPAAGEVIFQDSFDDDRNGWGVVDDPEHGSTSYEDGDYVWEFRGRVAHWIAGVLGEQYDRGELDMLDVVVRADATIVQGGGMIGVACRETPDTDAQFQWYEFVARDSYAAIRQADDQSNIDVLAETDDIQLPTGEPIAIEAGCIDDDDGVQLTLALNGAPVLQATDSDPLGNGVPGLQTWTHPIHEQMDIRWHEFSVHRPDS